MRCRAQRGRAWIRLLVGVAIAVVVLFVGAFVALSLVDWNKHVAQAAAEVKRLTGRELKVGGKVDIGVLPLRVIVNDVSFANAPWGTRPEMVKAKRVDVRAALLPLLTGNLSLKVDVIEPDVYLETDAKGTGNWVLARAGETGAQGGASESTALSVNLSAARITKGVVNYRSGRTGRSHRLTFEEAYIRSTGLSGREFLVKATIDGVPVSLAGSTDDWIIRTLAAGESLGITLEAKAAGASLSANGRVAFPETGPELALKVRAGALEAEKLGKLAGTRIPRLPPITAEGEIKSAKNVYEFDKLKLSMGKSRASGTVKVDASGARPKLAARIVAPVIDLLELDELDVVGGKAAGGNVAGGNAAGSKAESKTPGRIFSTDPLPLGPLNVFDADVDLNVERLALPPQLLVEALHGKIVLARGKLETRSLGMQIGGGNVKVDAALDARGARHAQLSTNIAGSDIELGKMLAALGREDFMTGGRTEISAELRAAGTSPATLASALDGHVKIVMGPARTRNRVLDRAGMDILTEVLNAVNPLRKTATYTEVQCAVVNVPVRDGVVTVDRTAAVETSQVGIAMAGTVNLAKETIDLSIRPQAKQGIGVGLGDLANLVKVTGTLSDPRVGVDIAGAASTAAQVGLGVMTSGLSLLAKGLFDKATMEAPCETALKRGVEPAAATPDSSGAEQPAAGGVGGFIERLFK
jgi:AsmA family protein